MKLVLAVLGMSLALSYVLWMRARVWIFRQDLFRIRDKVWDELMASGEVDDASHREFREGANSLIRIAPMLSLFTFMKTLLARKEVLSLLQPSTRLPEVERARSEVTARLVRYMLIETFSGLAVLAVAAAFGFATALQQAFARQAQWLFDSHTFQTIDRDFSSSSRQRIGSRC